MGGMLGTLHSAWCRQCRETSESNRARMFGQERNGTRFCGQTAAFLLAEWKIFLWTCLASESSTLSSLTTARETLECWIFIHKTLEGELSTEFLYFVIIQVPSNAQQSYYNKLSLFLLLSTIFTHTHQHTRGRTHTQFWYHLLTNKFFGWPGDGVQLETSRRISNWILWCGIRERWRGWRWWNFCTNAYFDHWFRSKVFYSHF